MVCSVTEGEDKPLKYPLMFRACELVIVNKIDLLPHLEFDLPKLLYNIDQVHPDVETLVDSPPGGAGRVVVRQPEAELGGQQAPAPEGVDDPAAAKREVLGIAAAAHFVRIRVIPQIDGVDDHAFDHFDTHVGHHLPQVVLQATAVELIGRDYPVEADAELGPLVERAVRITEEETQAKLRQLSSFEIIFKAQHLSEIAG